MGVVGTRMPQFSTARVSGISPRIGQAMVTFGVIGVVMIVLGLAALGLIRDPLSRLARLSRRFPNAPLVLVGALIGGFLVGRPYPLLGAMFRHAARTHNAFYGALAFTLQSIGNIVVMAVLFLALLAPSWLFLALLLLGGRLQRWLADRPSRVTVLTAAAFLVAGAFLVVYWDVRLLGRLGYIWFPTPPWS